MGHEDFSEWLKIMGGNLAYLGVCRQRKNYTLPLWAAFATLRRAKKDISLAEALA
jgi:hypothetical protein